MNHRTMRALVAAAVALALGACTDVPTGAPAVQAMDRAAARSAGAGRPTLVPNTVKYRDSGGKPSTGRSGSAALQAFALVDKAGRTDLEFRAIPADPDKWWLTGTLTRAQVKALDADGTVMFTYNRNQLDAQGTVAQFNSLRAGQYLQVQANVTGIDPHRTDVVTVTERIRRRPDLAVQLEMATEVLAGQSVPIHATIMELNGDVGTYAQCMLLVDGRMVDWAMGVWIDAGDAVTCAFTHTFAPGTHEVQVATAAADLRDWDESNNASAVVLVEAVGAPAKLSYHASATAQRNHWRTRDESRWHNPTTQQRGEYLSEFSTDEDTEYAVLNGSVPQGLTGEVSMEVSQSTSGRVLHTDAWTEALPGCTWRAGGGTSFFLCSYTAPFSPITFFSYVRNAGSVTYHSSFFSRVWDEVTGEDIYYYHDNSTWGWQEGALAGLGDDYAFFVRITQGDVVLTADSRFPVHQGAPYSYTYSDCSSYSDPWDGFTSEVCYLYESWSESSSGLDAN